MNDTWKTTYDYKIIGHRGIPRKVLGEQPVRHSQQGEGKNQCQEDDHEADICTKCADEEDERKYSHKDEEEAYAVTKTRQHLSIRECRHESTTRADRKDHEGSLPNPALNACVVRPTDAACPAGANDEKAAKDGLRVPPSDKKNAPNVQNTTDGNVFPSTNSRSPVVNWSRPPKKKNCGLEGVNIINRYVSLRVSKDSHPARTTAGSASPLHHTTRQGRQGEQKSYETAVVSMGSATHTKLILWKRRVLISKSQGNTHRSRVAKGFPQLSADVRLGSKIKLLE